MVRSENMQLECTICHELYEEIHWIDPLTKLMKKGLCPKCAIQMKHVEIQDAA